MTAAQDTRAHTHTHTCTCRLEKKDTEHAHTCTVERRKFLPQCPRLQIKIPHSPLRVWSSSGPPTKGTRGTRGRTVYGPYSRQLRPPTQNRWRCACLRLPPPSLGAESGDRVCSFQDETVGGKNNTKKRGSWARASEPYCMLPCRPTTCTAARRPYCCTNSSSRSRASHPSRIFNFLKKQLVLQRYYSTILVLSHTTSQRGTFQGTLIARTSDNGA